ncbi:hypothetical protein SAMN05421630_110127 [Prauserella marina]|uniref:Uncharacterized protein n=1 Tax=Prauserella marina TaxID=530584 RepID=A0A1G6W383_9PSEU|nr:hypothetical protein [Prauserella marina]PWV73954.1 hypothetical protein DES30_108127 [Prauserella marina]SDD59697.1 hypothetical protein SAMN05421630_110127 [Prauserella marina]
MNDPTRDNEAAGTRPWQDGMPEGAEPDYTADGMPTFDYVRGKIEQRSATAEASGELAGLGTGRSLADEDKKIADRKQAAKDKLAEIRESMRDR